MSMISSYHKLFKLADRYDFAMMFIGTAGALLNGLSLPAMYVIQSFIYDNYGRVRGSASNAKTQAILCIYVALITFVTAFLEVSCWTWTGQRQSKRLRIKYISLILSQDASYFDCNYSAAEVISNVSREVTHVQHAIGEKFGNFIQNMAQFFGGIVASLILIWKLSLIVSPFILFLLLPGFFYGKVLSTCSKKGATAYSKAANVVQQASSSIRTVHAFVAEKRTLKSYSAYLEEAAKLDVKQGLAKGLAIGLNGLRYLVWALVTWYGSIQVMQGNANGAQVLNGGSAFIMGSMALGNAVQNLKEIYEGHSAIQKIFKVFHSIPCIGIENCNGHTLALKGSIEFRNVVFSYPSRPAIRILDDFSIHIPSGQTTALVGKSGSGKSTVISLLERFYDPAQGEILIDERNIKLLNLKWFRKQIGWVCQEPALFSTTIEDNILVGKEHATIEEVIEAAQIADADSFITSFPEGYNTKVGEHGMQLSGGQKQRIAIARAIIRDPRIFLFDEATSALDNESEKTIQDTLKQVCVNRTTIIIAHRTTSVEMADYIAVIGKGKALRIRKNDFSHKDVQPMLQAVQESITLVNSRNEEFNDIEHRKKATKGKSKKSMFIKLLSLNRPEWRHLLLGTVGATAVGFVHPLFVVIGGTAISSFYDMDKHKMERTTKVTSYAFVVLGLMSFLINVIQHYSFGVMGAHLTKRVREQMLEKILHFEIEWFDKEENASGAICSRLASDASKVRVLVGDSVSLILQTVSTLSVSIGMSFIISWRLAVVISCVQPLILFCFYLRVSKLKKSTKRTSTAQEQITQLAVEAVSQHRTVLAFSTHGRIINILRNRLQALEKESIFSSQITAIGYGVAMFALYSSYGLCIWYGGRLMSEGKCTFKGFLIIFYLLIGTGRSLSDVLALSPDISKGMTVADSVFSILERSTTICDTEKNSISRLKGKIEFDRVDFAYGTRPDILILKNFCFTVEAAQTVALVGKSGSGKSTVFGLLERFYDPLKGHIMIDDKEITSFNLKSLRRQIGLVNQEPALFSISIKDNIAYGTENATESEIIAAANEANAHSFISGLPQGYQTPVGQGGAQLSGGQKQRIAIARAILRRPAILLMDEATSALDTDSEHAVQNALRRIMVSTSTLIVAHRQSSIQNADVIALLEDGRISEIKLGANYTS